MPPPPNYFSQVPSFTQSDVARSIGSNEPISLTIARREQELAELKRLCQSMERRKVEEMRRLRRCPPGQVEICVETFDDEGATSQAPTTPVCSEEMGSAVLGRDER